VEGAAGVRQVLREEVKGMRSEMGELKKMLWDAPSDAPGNAFSMCLPRPVPQRGTAPRCAAPHTACCVRGAEAGAPILLCLTWSGASACITAVGGAGDAAGHGNSEGTVEAAEEEPPAAAGAAKPQGYMSSAVSTVTALLPGGSGKGPQRAARPTETSEK